MRTAEKFWEKVDASGDCWLWMGGLNTGGYGRFTLDGRRQRAHRVAYALLVAPVPSGLELDHLCRVRHCVNPDHLEPVTRRENLLRGAGPAQAGYRQKRKTHCPQGHPYDESNTFVWAARPSERSCIECNRVRAREYQRKKRGAVR